MSKFSSIVITGASGGIGSRLAMAYAAPGVTLALIGRDAERLRFVAEAARQKGSKVVVGAIDIRERRVLQEWLASHDDHTPVDLLVANAGVSCGLGPDRAPEREEDAERLAEINYKGTVNTVMALVERMRMRRRGRIVLISSLAGMRGVPDMPSYSATKAALIAYGEALRGWLGRDGVGVTVICPGFVTSPMSARHKGARPFEMSAERAAFLIERAIRRGKPFYAFPFLLAWGVRFWRLLPTRLGDLAYRPMQAEVERDPRADPYKDYGT